MNEKMNPTSKVDSFYVYASIYPTKNSLWMWFLAGGSGLVMFLMSFTERKGEWMMYIGLVLLGVCILRIALLQLMKITSYKTYKNFRANVGFEIDGWDGMPIEQKILQAQNWAFESSVVVKTKEGANEEDLSLINEALNLFMADANSRFYAGSYGSDARRKWVLVGPLKVTGSADVAVTGDMYTLLNVYLKNIQQKNPVISSVKVKWGDKIEYVKFRKGRY